LIGRCCIAAGAWATVESTPLLFKAAIKDPRTLCGKHSGYVERRRAGHAGVFSVIYADLLSVRCVWYYLHEAGSTRRLFMMYASHRVHSYVTNIFVNGCSLVEHLMQTASWFFLCFDSCQAERCSTCSLTNLQRKATNVLCQHMII